MILVLIFASLVISVTAGCGGETSAPVVDDIDLSSLGLSIDVETTNALLDNPDVFMLDVREQDEYDAGHIPGITLIPTGEIADRLSEIPTDQTVIVTCRSGNRSAQVTDFLRDMGYTNVHNMEGGILAWEEAGYAIER